MRWQHRAHLLISKGVESQGFDACIERIDIESGAIERVVGDVEGHALQAADGLVFGDDGFWVTKESQQRSNFSTIKARLPQRNVVALAYVSSDACITIVNDLGTPVAAFP